MAYQLGTKALWRLVQDADALAFFNAKLSDPLFLGAEEKAMYAFVADHVQQFNTLPKAETFIAAFPELAEVAAPEPVNYYLAKVEERFAYHVINTANLDSQAILKADQSAVEPALGKLRDAIDAITLQRFRQRVVNMGVEAQKLLWTEYHNAAKEITSACQFGWPYLDEQGGLPEGEVGSMVGRPAMGKSWFVFYTGVHNWRRGVNTMIVSMEMGAIPVAQRIAAMYAGTNIGQMKSGGYSSHTLNLFRQGLSNMGKEEANLYVVDSNLGGSTEDIYALAAQLHVKCVVIDGAYMVRHRDPRVNRDRYLRVAENAESIKRLSADTRASTFASWQFSRDAVKKEKKKGQKVGLEDIGYSDVIGQISAVVAGLFQEEGIETINSRSIDVLKGRNGEVGRFAVNWDFQRMRFNQVEEEDKTAALAYI